MFFSSFPCHECAVDIFTLEIVVLCFFYLVFTVIIYLQLAAFCFRCPRDYMHCFGCPRDYMHCFGCPRDYMHVNTYNSPSHWWKNFNMWDFGCDFSSRLSRNRQSSKLWCIHKKFHVYAWLVLSLVIYSFSWSPRIITWGTPVPFPVLEFVFKGEKKELNQKH